MKIFCVDFIIWDRDASLVHPAIKLAIQYRFLEEIVKNYGEKIENTSKERHI